METDNLNERHASFDDSQRAPTPKRFKPASEVPAQYSDAVRRKLANTSRTGQACDRCKERKMKCDTDPIACQPCRQKNLSCFTTDRVSGQARERGQTDRAEGELIYLREQLRAYQKKYGTLTQDEQPMLPLPDQPKIPLPNGLYIGWPAPDHVEPIQKGPIQGTKVDIMDGMIDVSDFDCEVMRSPASGQLDVFNVSRTSVVNTIFGYQRVMDPHLPSKEEALREIDHFLVIMLQYAPVVHRPSFKALVNRFYDHPESVSIPERVQVILVLATIAQQTATRNHATSAENFEKAHRYLHYALGFYRDVYHDISLKSMQALALLVLHFRNLPKPGIAWSFSHQVLVRTIELRYHRDPDKIELPKDERSPLAKELRKRVFHSLLGICATTGLRVGLPAPWQFQLVDVPLPLHIKDSEISAEGIVSNPTGDCDYLPCLQLSKQIPLLAEIYNHIISVRRSDSDYVKALEALHTKIIAWRQDWDEMLKTENKPLQLNLQVASLLVEQWAAEYTLILHHPVNCTSTDPAVIEKNLDVCHKSAKRLLSAFHTLSNKYKAVDFTWHSTAPHAMAFGITLYIYRKKKAQVTTEQFEAMRNELKGWMSLMAYADLVMRTGNHLQHTFQPRVQALEKEYRDLIIDQRATQLPRESSQTSFNAYQQVNGIPANSPVKSESTPQQGTLSNNTSVSANSQQHAFVAKPPVNGGSVPNGNQSLANYPPAWGSGSPQPMRQYTPSSVTTMSQPYSPYNAAPPSQQSQSQSFGPPRQTPAQQYPAASPQAPTTLAPILNNNSHSTAPAYYSNGASHPTNQPPQGQNAIAVSGDYTYMSFSPSHYYDNHVSMGWPLINMQTGQQ